jgi:predicted Fe-S protein YdhL (DUF1289 family)
VSARKKIKTPCIGICSTGIGDSVCRGCKRYVHEVIDWNHYSEEQKYLVDKRLERFLTDVVKSKLAVTDTKRLQSQLEELQVEYSKHKDPHVWVYELLRAGAGQLNDLSDYGVRLHGHCRNSALPTLKTAIDEGFFALAQAHYDRYF